MNIAITVACIVLSVHFGRTACGQFYRALPAYFAKREALAQMLQKFKDDVVTQVVEDGKTIERTERVLDVAAITVVERTKFFLHLLLAS